MKLENDCVTTKLISAANRESFFWLIIFQVEAIPLTENLFQARNIFMH